MYSTILRSSGQECDEKTFKRHSVRSNGSKAQIKVKSPTKNHILRIRNITKKLLGDNNMTPERDTTLIRRVKIFPVESRKKEFDEIVLNWDISVDQ